MDEFVALPSIMALEDDVAVAEPEGLGRGSRAVYCKLSLAECSN